MIPVSEKPRRVSIYRNRSCFLLGASWSHHKSFPSRSAHLYLGWWVLTIRVPASGDREPQPSDGPDYHADHAAWVERQKPAPASGEQQP